MASRRDVKRPIRCRSLDQHDENQTIRRPGAIDRGELKPEGLALAHRLAEIAARFTTFFTLDVAETESGDWILSEIDDGQMAVPSENDLDELYGRLNSCL